MRRRGISFAVLTAITSSLVVAASAQATYHENLIREVHEGGGPATTSSCRLTRRVRTRSAESTSTPTTVVERCSPRR